MFEDAFETGVRRLTDLPGTFVDNIGEGLFELSKRYRSQDAVVKRKLRVFHRLIELKPMGIGGLGIE
jgi:hypothetical protein